MSLYNMVHGTSNQLPIVLHLLGKTPDDFRRFRDAWVEKNAAGQLRFVVYTRCGGGNRDDYEGMFEEMRAHPLYMGDEDDDFDCTYASVFFRVPEGADEQIRALAKENGVDLAHGWKLADVAQDTVRMGDRWQASIDALSAASKETTIGRESPSEGDEP